MIMNMANISRKNLISSTISGQLIANYTHADYRIGTGPESISLRIDQYSEPLAQFLVTIKHACAAIICAYNPRSELLSDEENLAAYESLRNLLQQHSYPVIESLHTDPAGTWPPEKGFFIPGMGLNAAKTVGLQFNQNAIVWIDCDTIPRLILLR